MRTFAATLSFGLLAAATPCASGAQDGYMLVTPVLTLSLRGGASVPLASDDLHDFFIRDLTLERRDFASIAFGVGAAVRVTPRLDLVADVSRAKTSKPSEYRDWTHLDDSPVEQTTELKRTMAFVGARYLLASRGRAVGSLAWVPSSLVPYLGAGVGVIWYGLEQQGQFVDEERQEFFADFNYAEGNAPMANAFAGLEWWTSSQFGLTLEGRFTYARADLKPDYTAFDTIDLSGFQFMAGLAYRF